MGNQCRAFDCCVLPPVIALVAGKEPPLKGLEPTTKYQFLFPYFRPWRHGRTSHLRASAIGTNGPGSKLGRYIVDQRSYPRHMRRRFARLGTWQRRWATERKRLSAFTCKHLSQASVGVGFDPLGQDGKKNRHGNGGALSTRRLGATQPPPSCPPAQQNVESRSLMW
jgi:hypothetical protein